MPQKRLNPELLAKMAEKSGKSQQYLREQISRRASRQSISSTAAQLVWAKALGIGIAHAFNKAPMEVREEVRGVEKVPATASVRAIKRNVPARKRKAEPI